MKGAVNELLEEPKEGCKNYELRKSRWVERPHLNLLLKQLVGNVGMIFSNGDLTEVKAVLDKQAREAPAKPGMIAPSEVFIQPGPTGLDPKQTQFFQALNIQTKIVKAQIEIANAVKVIKEGEKVNQSQAALLEKLKIRPFEYKMHVRSVMDGGKIYKPSVLNIKSDDILKAFKEAGSNLTATSLGSGYIVSSAAPHLILNAFKNLACAAIGGDYSFPQAEKFKNSGAPASAPAQAAPAKKAEAAPAKVEPAKKDEPEEDMDMGGLFD
jgi:large subunit ribosomal protein LP0